MKNLEKYKMYHEENETELKGYEEERKKLIEKIRRCRTMKEKIEGWIKEEGGEIKEKKEEKKEDKKLVPIKEEKKN